MIIKEPFDIEGIGKGTAYRYRWGENSPIKVSALHHTDGSFTIIHHKDKVQDEVKFWNYSDTIEGLRDCISQAIRDNDIKRREDVSQSSLDEFIGEASKTLTLNRDQARLTLTYCKWRQREEGGVEILYNSRWLHLCRTDLYLDIRTWTSRASHGNPDSLSFYIDTVAFGARITEDAFFIVDSLSDG